MAVRSFASRLAALERLEAVYNPRVPFEELSDAELEEYCNTHCKDLKHLTDEQLQALIDGERYA